MEGKLAWVHCARTGKYTLLMVHPKRGRQAIEAMGVLPSFAGVAVHDAWAPYDTYTGAGHQLCCAHALRELQAVADLAPEGEWCWATQAGEALTTMQALVSEAIYRGRDFVDPDALAGQVTRYRSAALIGISQTRDRPGALARKHHALARRLLGRQDDYLRFTQDWEVPPDNEGVSYCTSWVRSGVSRFLCWSARCVVSMAWGTDSFRQWAAEAGVVAAA